MPCQGKPGCASPAGAPARNATPSCRRLTRTRAEGVPTGLCRHKKGRLRAVGLSIARIACAVRRCRPEELGLTDECCVGYNRASRATAPGGERCHHHLGSMLPLRSLCPARRPLCSCATVSPRRPPRDIRPAPPAEVTLGSRAEQEIRLRPSDRPPVVVHVVGCASRSLLLPAEPRLMPLSAGGAKRAPICAINLRMPARWRADTCRAGRSRRAPAAQVAFAAGRAPGLPGPFA